MYVCGGVLFIFLSLSLNIYLCLERGTGREKERRETSMYGCLSSVLHWGPDTQPRHVLWLGIKPETLWFAAHTQFTELHQPRHKYVNFYLLQNRHSLEFSPQVFSNLPGLKSNLRYKRFFFLLPFFRAPSNLNTWIPRPQWSPQDADSSARYSRHPGSLSLTLPLLGVSPAVGMGLTQACQAVCVTRLIHKLAVLIVVIIIVKAIIAAIT